MGRLALIALAVLAARSPLRAERILAEPLPDPLIPGYRFPESEATLTGWITEMSRDLAEDASSAAFAKIHLHGWGLWTAVTAETRQVFGGQRLRVFETWTTPDDLLNGANPGEVAPAPAGARTRAPLRPLNQFRRGPGLSDEHELIEGESDVDRVVGFVKFDPTAAAHIVKQELLSASALDRLLEGGAQQIPAFPATAIAVKPVFQLIKSADLVGGRFYALKVWSGPPSTPEPWSPARWPGVVWLDVQGGGRGRGAVDESGRVDGSARTEAMTYPLSSLINFRLSAADAAALNQSKPGSEARGGDRAVLVAMHVSSREIARWTWQTFWWTPTPADPHAPSSAAIAGLRPGRLQGAARNYAMALAYTQLSPDQPYVGGENAGTSVYAYNPWIEARFAAAELPDSIPGYDEIGRPVPNNLGVQTNCMSCHARANYNPHQLPTAPDFSGARYSDLGDPSFIGTLQVDFLWSIARHAR